jgi:gamma-glutamyltranspeptidase/glutathione hydrolase
MNSPVKTSGLLLLSVASLVVRFPFASAQAASPQPSLPAVLNWQKEEPVRTRHAMVVSIHHLAADAGVIILKQGGNAVDAAVATGFALAVVYPDAGNLGGGGFMTIHLAKKGSAAAKDTFIDYRERAPEVATRDMYLDKQGNIIPGLSTIGYKAIAVPGSVAGMVYAEAKYGKLGLKAVMAPAIALASDGWVLGDEDAGMLHDRDLAKFPESKRIFQRDGNFYKPGDSFRQPDLAATLRTVASDPGDFYHGVIAKRLAEDVQKGGGIITESDLAHYEVKERQPLTAKYEGYDIVTAPPPSSGGVAVIETLNILRDYNLRHLGDRTAPEMHLIIEAYRRAFMDHADYLGDPDYANIPVDALLNQKYADAFRNSIQEDTATPSKELVRPAGFLPPPPVPPLPEHTNTTHYSVLDEEGNAVAVTTTLNDSFGSHATAEGLGFLLNDEMDDFSSKPGAPNMFGLIQGPNADIAPGHRPLSSMTPTIVLKDGQVRYVLGSPGGSRIITTVANIFLSAVDEGLNIQQAVDAPRFHHQYLPDVLLIEPGFPQSTIEGLRAMGYQIQEGGSWPVWSDGECIAVDPKTGDLLGGQDHRHHFGKAAGY